MHSVILIDQIGHGVDFPLPGQDLVMIGDLLFRYDLLFH
jgi:hypothetical protein